MRIRRVMITNVGNLKDATSLASEPEVRNVLFGPNGIVLYEIYDPIFEKTYHVDQGVRRQAEAEDGEAITKREWELQAKERSILAPLFAGKGKLFFGVDMGIPTHAALYQFMERKRRKWPSLVLPARWEQSLDIRLSVELLIFDAELQEQLRSQVTTWRDWALQTGVLRSAKLSVSEKVPVTICDLLFNQPCGDWIIVLLGMLMRCSFLPLHEIRIEPVSSTPAAP